MTFKLNSMTKNKSIQRIPMKHFLVIPPIGLLVITTNRTGGPVTPPVRSRGTGVEFNAYL